MIMLVWAYTSVCGREMCTIMAPIAFSVAETYV